MIDGLGVAESGLGAEAEESVQTPAVPVRSLCLLEDPILAQELGGGPELEADPALPERHLPGRSAEMDEKVRVGGSRPPGVPEVEVRTQARADRIGKDDLPLTDKQPTITNIESATGGEVRRCAVRGR